jgi:hypothetical protein
MKKWTKEGQGDKPMWNPFKKKPALPKVFVSADPNHPHVGLSVFSETKLSGPSLCVVGISLAEARLDLCGKVIDWSRMTPQQAEAIKVGGKVTLPLNTFKSLFK